MENKICFIQFLHPGKETGNNRFLKWNCGEQHYRKFMLANGDYVDDNGKLVTNKLLTFWGEWEPMSKRIRNYPKPQPHYPKRLQEPILDLSDSDCSNPKRKNTDPFVFTKGFRYSGCKQKQIRDAGEFLNQTSRLMPGSIILFGSNFNNGKHDAYFGVDTVFVVGSYRDIDCFNQKGNVDIAQDPFFPPHYDIIMNPPKSKSSSKGSKNNCWGPRFYIGATPDNPVEGMYSFVPCKIYDENQAQGFERPRITQKDIANLAEMSDQLNSNFKKSYTTLKTNKKIWDKLRRNFAKQGFFEGVRFDYTLLP